ncbi:efflux RND transporter periplasmic adaptor subunit [Acidovorax sp. NCPPB 3576]|uniref:efflux RND transporter periplasmic adaptor subunit n=1 Tax=Acidovorax sp. NCPPB 3576 TaxID=2940488 RepID=UPI00234A168D|nr:efflux RND transporter periplasmic adaptor subunit [Acidovorax sp. NCPPB 3576]WCM87998.1 efflux RND transporter periplasmic adaptor subunit [Acidovorax sp. NCPPB 3576]
MSNTLNNSTGKTGKRQWLVVAAILVITLIAGALILRGNSAPVQGGHAEADSHASHAEEASHGSHDEKGAPQESHAGEEAAKGPNGGQLFTEDGFGLEAKVSEDGGAPHLAVWLFEQGKPLKADATQVSATLTRPGGERQTLSFAADGAGLKSVQPVEEPHVFEITLSVQKDGRARAFTLHQEEGKIPLTEAQAKASGIAIDTAGPARLRASLQLPGEIKFNEDRTAHVVPRLAGVVESVSAQLGQQVRKGQVLAVLSSPALSEQRSELQTAQRRAELARTTYEREKKLWEEKISPEQDYLQAQQSLREAQIAVANAQQKLSAIGATPASSALGRYELRAPFDGMVVEKHLSLGESVKEDANVFTLSDLSTVWAEISVAAQHLPLVRGGERVTVRSTAFDAKAEGEVSYVGALIGAQTRMATARVAVLNPQKVWRPGLFVEVELVSSETAAPVTVLTDAVQTIDEKTVVFIRVEGGFIPQPVQLGRTDGQRVEVVKGLAAGTAYAAAGSFVVKSQQGKSSASHSH